MKNLIRIGLLALLPFFASAQVTWPDIATQDQLRKTNARIDSLNFAISGVKPGSPVRELPDCPKGPVIEKITKITNTGASIQFDGNGVTELTYRIFSKDNIQLYTGDVKPKSSIFEIGYTYLIPSTYYLSLEGKSCKSKPFPKAPLVVPNLGTGVILPDPIKPDPGKVDNSGMPVYIAQGMPEHLDLNWRKEGDKLFVTDNSNVDLPSGYEYRYIIGGQVHLLQNPLKDYPFQNFNPSRVLKFRTKIGKVLNQWEDQPGVGYYDKDAALSFSYNTSTALSTFFFPGVKSGFIQHIPDWYNPLLSNTQWGDHAPDMKLPKGHFFVADPRSWGIEKTIKMGVTHISNFHLPWDNPSEVVRLRDAGVTYNDVPRIETIFKLEKRTNTGQLWPNNTSKDWWPNGFVSCEQAVQAANNADIEHALFIAEMSENEAWQPENEPSWLCFYTRLKDRYQERFGKRGIPFQIVHNYYHLWGERFNLDTGKGIDYYKRLLTLPASQIPTNPFSPGGPLSPTTMIVEGVYLSAPDITIAQPLEMLFHLELTKQLGYDAGVFLTGVHEWKPNNWQRYIYPEGTFYATTKAPLDPSVHIANGFLAQVFGKLFVEWGAAGKTAHRRFDKAWNPGLWLPNGSSSFQDGFPHYRKQSDTEEYYGYNGSTDLSYFSQKLFNDSFGQVEGGTSKYLKFRIDGGGWINPNEDDFVDAYFGKRGFAYARVNNGKTAWFYLNCFADNITHKIDVEMPDGRIVSEWVSGNGIHTKLI
jgi:hypothetical protein